MTFLSKKRVILWVVMILLLFAAINESDRQDGLGYSPEELYFRNLIEKCMGLTCNRDLPYIREITCNNGSWVVELNADSHSDSNMIRGMVMFKSFSLFDVVFKGRNDIEAVSLQWFFPLKVCDEVTDQPIIKIRMDRGTEEKTEWNMVLTRELPTVADEYWEHPSLAETF